MSGPCFRGVAEIEREERLEAGGGGAEGAPFEEVAALWGVGGVVIVAELGSEGVDACGEGGVGERAAAEELIGIGEALSEGWVGHHETRPVEPGHGGVVGVVGETVFAGTAVVAVVVLPAGAGGGVDAGEVGIEAAGDTEGEVVVPERTGDEFTAAVLMEVGAADVAVLGADEFGEDGHGGEGGWIGPCGVAGDGVEGGGGSEGGVEAIDP